MVALLHPVHRETVEQLVERAVREAREAQADLEALLAELITDAGREGDVLAG